VTLRSRWDALPTWGRWGALGGAGLLAALLLLTGGWYWSERRQEAAQTAFDQAFILYRVAVGQESPERLQQAAQALEGLIRNYPSHRTTPLVYYSLGNLYYRVRAYAKAAENFERAARTGRGGIVGLSQLGLGYSWEGQGDPARALAAYEESLRGRDPQDPLYGELLLAVARSQLVLKRPAEAKVTYERFLKDLPGSPQVQDVKARLARVEEARTP